MQSAGFASIGIGIDNKFRSIRSTDTRYFTDPSIATAALGLGPSNLMDDLKTFGLFFETLVARDLRTYAEANDGKVSHYRDKSGLECDAVMHLRDGRYGLIEVKIGGAALIDDGRKKLSRRSPSRALVGVPHGSDRYAVVAAVFSLAETVRIEVETPRLPRVASMSM